VGEGEAEDKFTDSDCQSVKCKLVRSLVRSRVHSFVCMCACTFMRMYACSLKGARGSSRMTHS
jgi:hypothetical protein